MTAQQIADREILYEQGYVINELLRVNESLWDRISNTEEYDEVFEWWLVTPYLAESQTMIATGGEELLPDRLCIWTM